MEMKLSSFKAIRFFLNMREEIIHTQMLIRALRDETRLADAKPTINEKTYLSFEEAAQYIDSTPNFVKNLVKNGDIDSYVSPYKGYTWVKRTDLDKMISGLRILSNENRKIEAHSRSKKK